MNRWSRYPGDRSYLKDHPMFDPVDYCEKCKRGIGPKECLYELGKDYVCEQCMEDHFEELGVLREGDR